jgi:hypothetical protein
MDCSCWQTSREPRTCADWTRAIPSSHFYAKAQVESALHHASAALSALTNSSCGAACSARQAVACQLLRLATEGGSSQQQQQHQKQQAAVTALDCLPWDEICRWQQLRRSALPVCVPAQRLVPLQLQLEPEHTPTHLSSPRFPPVTLPPEALAGALLLRPALLERLLDDLARGCCGGPGAESSSGGGGLLSRSIARHPYCQSLPSVFATQPALFLKVGLSLRPALQRWGNQPVQRLNCH